jgi:hypothetical protein
MISASLNRRSANVVVRLGCEPKTMTETTGCRSPKARLFDQAETKPRPSPPRPPRPARDHNEIRPRPRRDYLRKVTETTETAPYREGENGLAPRARPQPPLAPRSRFAGAALAGHSLHIARGNCHQHQPQASRPHVQSSIRGPPRRHASHPKHANPDRPPPAKPKETAERCATEGIGR